MEKTYTSNIESVMQILETHFHHTERTTLNKMGKEKTPDAFKILISCLLSLRAKDKVTERIAKDLTILITPSSFIIFPIIFKYQSPPVWHWIG